LVIATAAELPRVGLRDALEVCLLLRDSDPDRYERAAVRWAGRFALEASAVSLEAIERAIAALSALPDRPEDAMDRASMRRAPGQLVVHPVNARSHASRRLAGVGPLERLGGLVVGLDVGEHLLGEVFFTGEDAVLEQSAPEDREEDLDLVCEHECEGESM